ncbi:hypothetical protein X732_29615 [Mesorhizobium sp. L2C066B000]|nr:hypothetical protein X732_29615 [Mesorhizobium sp. L2C066B000]
MSVPLLADAPQLSDAVVEVKLSEAHWLLASLAVEALTRLFTELGRPILRSRPLRLLSQKPANLFPENVGLPDWLQRRVVLDLETRKIWRQDGDPTLVLLCDVRTQNFIDVPTDKLMATGVSVMGRYVSRMVSSDDPRITSHLKLAGRVISIEGDRLLLADFGEGPDSISIAHAYLERRRENVDWCVQQLNPAKAGQILMSVQAEAAKFLNGPGRFELIKRTFDYLRTQSIELVPDVKLELGDLIGMGAARWPFRQETIKKPTLVFDPSGVKTDTWNERGLDKHGPYDQRTFSPKEMRIAVICREADEGRVEGFLAKFLDGMPHVIVGENRKPYEKGFIRRFALSAPKVHTFTAKSSSVPDYLNACRAALKFAHDQGFEWSLAIAQIDKDFRELLGPDNPYFAIKAAFLKQRVPIQELTLETMSTPDRQLVYILNNISLASYAKIGGIPWLLKSGPTVGHELVIGIGSQTVSSSRLGEKQRVVGITTVFTHDGRYLLDDRTRAVPYGEYEAALSETLTRAIERVRTEDNWRSTDAVRLVFHVFQQIKDYEADAVGKLVENLGFSDVKYAFVHVVDSHPYTLFDEHMPGVKFGYEMKGAYAPERGLCISLGRDERLLSFTGSREVKQTHHGLPRPTLLRLHRNSTFRDMTYIARQAFDFANHSWRMLTPAPLPITIHYAELIARLLAGLKDTPGWDEDTMLGPVGRTRWFL